MSAEFLAPQLPGWAAVAVILGGLALFLVGGVWLQTVGEKRQVSRIVESAVDALREAEAAAIEPGYIVPLPRLDEIAMATAKAIGVTGGREGRLNPALASICLSPEGEFHRLRREVERKLRREVGAEYVVQLECSEDGHHAIFTRKGR